jgi:hypothetical protein
MRLLVGDRAWRARECIATDLIATSAAHPSWARLHKPLHSDVRRETRPSQLVVRRQQRRSLPCATLTIIGCHVGEVMLRVALALAAALIVAGCATTGSEATGSTTSAADRPKQAKAPIQNCTTTVHESGVCRVPMNCPQIATCGEANYRLTTCGHRWLDGGPKGRNGIPCQAVCGRDAKTMSERIAAKPFSPPAHSKTTECSPPAKV